MIYWIPAFVINAWWPKGRQPCLPLWKETPEFIRRQPGDPTRTIRYLKAKERIYAEMGGGWGQTKDNPFNALIFEDEDFVERREKALKEGRLLKRGPRW